MCGPYGTTGCTLAASSLLKLDDHQVKCETSRDFIRIRRPTKHFANPPLSFFTFPVRKEATLLYRSVHFRRHQSVHQCKHVCLSNTSIWLIALFSFRTKNRSASPDYRMQVGWNCIGSQVSCLFIISWGGLGCSVHKTISLLETHWSAVFQERIAWNKITIPATKSPKPMVVRVMKQ